MRLGCKRPDEVRRYQHNWAPWLGTDTISSHTTTASGVTLDSVTIEDDDQTVIFKISGGTDGTVGRIDHEIITSAGEKETEIFTLRISESEEPISLAEAKAYLRVTHTDEDTKIRRMISAARLWVEDHTGLALIQREFVERHLPETSGAIRLSRGPLVSVDAVDYVDSSGAAATYTPRVFPPDRKIIAAADEAWPGLQDGEAFEITYTAGFDSVEETDERLLGAMLALIEGEYAEGYAYPDRAIQAAERCCAYLKAMVA